VEAAIFSSMLLVFSVRMYQEDEPDTPESEIPLINFRKLSLLDIYLILIQLAALSLSLFKSKNV